MKQSVAEKLMALLTEARTGGAQVVMLQGEVGRGKTYAIQQFYDALCATETPPHPWAAGLVPTAIPQSTRRLLDERKAVRGIKTGTISPTTPWLWIGSTCSSQYGEFDVAAADLSRQLDDFVDDLGHEATLGALKVLGSGALDVASDLLQISTAKTIVETVVGLAHVLTTEYESRPGARVAALREQRAKLVHDALRRLKIDDLRDDVGRPLVVVLDDAHLSDQEALRLLSTLLMPGGGATSSGSYFPSGVAVRQNPILVVLCSWPHTHRAPAYESSPLNTWLEDARRVGVPITEIHVPNGLPREDAIALARKNLPPLSLADQELVVGSPGAASVNPLVLKMRIGATAGYLDADDRRVGLADLDVSRLPTSPLDPIRDLFEALPPAEKKVIATAAHFGPFIPWRLLAEAPDATPEATIPEALSVGLVARMGRPEDILAVVGFTDDLSVAFFQQDSATLFPLGEISTVGVLGRLRAWLEDLAHDEQLPVSALSAIGGVMATIIRSHGASPGMPDLTARILGEDPSANLTAQRMALVHSFMAEATEWDVDMLGGEILAIAATPRRIGSHAWTRIFATAAVQRYLRNRPRSLAARTIALSRNSMPLIEFGSILLAAAATDGETALWRLSEVAGLLRNFDLAAELEKVVEGDPRLFAEAALVVAHQRGPRHVVDLLQHRTTLTQTEAVTLSDSHAELGEFAEAATALGSLVEFEEFATRAARLFQRTGRVERALAALEPFITDSIGAALTAAEIEPDLDTALAILRPFLDTNVQARVKSSQLLSAAARYPEALAMVESLAGSTTKGVDQAIRSLRARNANAPRAELQAVAEESWRSGSFDEAQQLLRSGLDDPVILATWAEYAWALGTHDEVMAALVEGRKRESNLSISVAEFANEDREAARRDRWIADALPDDEDHWLGLIRLTHQMDSPDAVRDARFSDVPGLSSGLAGLVTAVAGSGKTWEHDLRLALSLERIGHVDWAHEVLRPWSGTTPGEAHSARLLVDYGQLEAARHRLFVSSNDSITMASARAIWHLAHGDAAEAGHAFAACSTPTPQVVRVTALLPRIDVDARAALEASRLLFQMRQRSTAVAVLAAAVKTLDNRDLAKAYRDARYQTPERQRKAFGRLRRRHAIRAARSEYLAGGDPAEGD